MTSALPDPLQRLQSPPQTDPRSEDALRRGHRRDGGAAGEEGAEVSQRGRERGRRRAENVRKLRGRPRRQERPAGGADGRQEAEEQLIPTADQRRAAGFSLFKLDFYLVLLRNKTFFFCCETKHINNTYKFDFRLIKLSFDASTVSVKSKRIR